MSAYYCDGKTAKDISTVKLIGFGTAEEVREAVHDPESWPPKFGFQIWHEQNNLSIRWRCIPVPKWNYRELATVLILHESSAERGFEPLVIGSMRKNLTTELSRHTRLSSVLIISSGI